MDNVNYHPKLLLRVVNDRLLAGDPFMLFDIGCGLGLDPVWRFFGDQLHAHAFDPQQAECAKLAAQEKNSHVRYHAAFVGLPSGDPFHAGRAQAEPGPHAAEYFSPSAQMLRGSSFAANARKPQPASQEPPSSLESTEQWATGRLSTRTIAIDDFVAEHDIANIDFVKIDTDGRDLEAAFSGRAAIRRAGILGFMVECFFTGSRDATENSFHNVDGFMRENGFLLYALTANKYLARGAAGAVSLPGVVPDHFRPGSLGRHDLSSRRCVQGLLDGLGRRPVVGDQAAEAGVSLRALPTARLCRRAARLPRRSGSASD